MTNNDHVINETILNFKFFGAENDLSIPDQLEHWFMQKTIGSIEEVCDSFTANGEYIEIDQLEINLGAVQLSVFEQGMQAIFKEHLRRQISEVLSTRTKTAQSESSAEKIGDNAVKQVFFHFLKFGYLPWEAAHLKVADLEKLILSGNRRLQPSILKSLLPLLKKNKIQKRLAFNFSVALISSIQRTFRMKYPNALESVSIVSDKLASPSRKKQAWKELANWSLEKTANGLLPYPKTLSKEQIPFLNFDAIEENGKEVVQERSIYVSDAGIVLMYPFIKTLFSKLGLMSEGIFKKKLHCEKAIWLLFFMVHGHLDLDESRTSLPKLLCGQSIHSTLEFGPKLSKKERKEVHRALRAAIGHWKVLKNTGTDAFRTTFLQRQGRIFLKDNEIEIVVEQESVDMLLNQLPWSLSHIRLPWVDRLIRVNWA